MLVALSEKLPLLSVSASGESMSQVKKITLGVFENNIAAYHCYKSVGFEDVESEKYEYYSINNQQWKCLELELRKEK